MKVISLGWGVQSFTLAAMVALGELEPIDAAIHADTTHESILTYQFASRWTPRLENHGVRVITVSIKNAAFYEMPKLSGLGTPPLYTAHPQDKPGQMMRSCTQRWKIAPMRRWIQDNRNGELVEQWIGISLDEFQRMKPSDVKYITTRWPLIEKRMTRKDCENWLRDHNLEVPPKSACAFCPYHNQAEWRRIKNTPEDWLKSVEVDKAIRNARPPYELFVHPSRKPLVDVDFRTAEEKGQLSLWDQECEGICGV